MNGDIVQYTHEHYFCAHCQKELTGDDLTTSWRCRTCSPSVIIHAEDWKGRRQSLRRLPVSEIKKDRSVVVPDGGFDYIYSVIENRCKDGVCELALKGYRKMRYDASRIIELIEGTWEK